jgi:hypothetical protein
MATNFDPLRDIPWMKDGRPLPSADPADLKSVWTMQQEVKKDLDKRLPNRNPNQGFSIGIDVYQRACSPGADAFLVWRRLAMLETVQRIFSEAGGTLPGFTDGKPRDAVFKALAIVPMTDGGQESIPIDAKELIRLIKKESEA